MLWVHVSSVISACRFLLLHLSCNWLIATFWRAEINKIIVTVAFIKIKTWYLLSYHNYCIFACLDPHTQFPLLLSPLTCSLNSTWMVAMSVGLSLLQWLVYLLIVVPQFTGEPCLVVLTTWSPSPLLDSITPLIFLPHMNRLPLEQRLSSVTWSMLNCLVMLQFPLKQSLSDSFKVSVCYNFCLHIIVAVIDHLCNKKHA